MSDVQIQFRGNVQVYLEGLGALEPNNGPAQDCMTYYVASPQSRITVRDFRPTPNKVARRVLEGQDGKMFAGAFSQPAQAEIRSYPDHVEIDLRDGQSNGQDPTLWLGVLEGERWPVHPTKWEVLEPVSETEIAFAALIV